MQSPQLLQLSGIGPAALLAAHGIPVVHDLPGVGENLQDHLQIRLHLQMPRPAPTTTWLNSWIAPAGARLAMARASQRAAGGGHQPGRLLHALAAGGDEDVPTSSSISATLSVPIMAGRQAASVLGLHHVDLPAAARERGHVRIRSADPLEPPPMSAELLWPSDLDVADGLARREGRCVRVAHRRRWRPFVKREVQARAGRRRATRNCSSGARDNGATTIFHPDRHLQDGRGD